MALTSSVMLGPLSTHLFLLKYLGKVDPMAMASHMTTVLKCRELELGAVNILK